MYLHILLALSALVTLSSAQDKWIPCASENAECIGLGGDNRDKQFWVKFRPDDTATSQYMPALYRQASNYAHCSVAFFGGDPAPGTKKSCSFLEVEHPVSPSLLLWTWPGEGANYGQTMNQSMRFGAYPKPEHPLVWQAGSTMLVKPGIHLLEVGIKDSWSVYDFVGDPKAWTEVKCGQNFGVRPGEAHQHCRLSDKPISLLADGNATWNQCGVHGKNCEMSSGQVWSAMGYIVRYGRGSAWQYQIVSAADGQLNVNLKCDATSFRGVTAHQDNQCQYTALPFETFFNNIGVWHLATSTCVPSGGSGFASYTVEHGLQRQKSTAQTDTFTSTITESVAFLIGVKDVKSTTFTATAQQAESIATMTQDTWTETEVTKSTSRINLGAANECAFVWSWHVSTTEMGGIGDPSTMVAMTVYVQATHSAYNPPPCPPSMMMPANCTWENCLRGGWPDTEYYNGGCNATYHMCTMNLCIPDYGSAPPTRYWGAPTSTPTTATTAFPTSTPTTATPTAFPSNAPITLTPTAKPTTATPTTATPTAFPSNAPIAPTPTAKPTPPSIPPTGSGQTCCRAINPTVTDAWCAPLGSSCSAYPDHCQIQPCR
jgi:hypothetical protein